MSFSQDLKTPFQNKPIHRISLYLAKSKYILVGYDRKKTVFSVLQIRNNLALGTAENITLDDLIKEDAQTFTRKQIGPYLKSLTAGCKFVCKAYAILGFIKFFEGFYMMLVTEAEVIAKIRNHRLYKANFVSYIQLFEPSSSNNNEKKYFQFLKTFDLGTGFYFSDTYDLTNSFQTNTVAELNQSIKNEKTYSYCHSEPIKTYNHMFMWNYYSILDFYRILKDKRWIIAFVHGYIEQIKVQKLVQAYQIVLIAKRSRYHAGTRYLTRGLNPEGFVGNFVETEQIVLDLNKGAIANPTCSSFVQVRGSVPIYWFQETKVVSPKPPINVNPSFDIFFEASRKHFADLYSLYGPVLFVLNLVKKDESTKREQYLTEEYQRALDAVNHDVPSDLKIIYYHQDMKALLKKDKEEFLNLTSSFAYVSLSKTGFFTAKRQSRKTGDQKLIPLTFQRGVIRSNCVDCLDRTNIFQQLVGETALSIQIAKLYQSNDTEADPASYLDDSVLKYFKEMYSRMGDVISLQYGGSIAHKSALASQGSSKQLEFVTSIKRYYSNTFIDQNKQNAINLFLGIHKAVLKATPIWEITNPIVLVPNFPAIRTAIPSSEKWWEAPLNKFHSTIIINNDLEVTNKVFNQQAFKSPHHMNNHYLNKVRHTLHITNAESKLSFSEKVNALVNDTGTMTSNSTQNYRYPSFRFSISSEKPFEDVPDIHSISVPKNNNLLANLASSEKPNEKKKVQWHVNDEIRDFSKSIDRKRIQTELIDLSNFRYNSINDTAILEAGIETPPVPEKLTDLSKKARKIYNNVLTVDDIQEDSEEEIEEKQRGLTIKARTTTKSVTISQEPILIGKEKRVFEDYCSMLEMDADTMFNQQKSENISQEELRIEFNEREIEEEMKAYCFYENRLNIDEIFPKTIKDYIKHGHEDSKLNYMFNSPKGSEIVRFDSQSNLKFETASSIKFDPRQTQNLKFMKNMVTALYPNLQKPNITKV